MQAETLSSAADEEGPGPTLAACFSEPHHSGGLEGCHLHRVPRSVSGRARTRTWVSACALRPAATGNDLSFSLGWHWPQGPGLLHWWRLKGAGSRVQAPEPDCVDLRAALTLRCVTQRVPEHPCASGLPFLEWGECPLRGAFVRLQ